MKSFFLSITLLGSLFFASCVAPLESEDIESGNGLDVKTINIIAPTIEFVGIDEFETRGEVRNQSGNIFTYYFDNGDAFGIFPTTGYQISFMVKDLPEMKNEVSISADGWATKKGLEYSCYYPFNYDYKDSRAIPFNYMGQSQDVNGSFKHLNDYALLVAPPVNDEEQTGDFNFQTHEVGATLRLNITVPRPGVYRKISLHLDDMEFTTMGTVSLFSGDSNVLTPLKTSPTVSLLLNDIAIDNVSTILQAHIRLAPIDLSGKTLYVWLYDSDNNIWEASRSFTNGNIKANTGYALPFAFSLKENTTSTVGDLYELENCLSQAANKNFDANALFINNAPIDVITIPTSLANRGDANIELEFENILVGAGPENMVTISSQGQEGTSASLSTVTLTTPEVPNGTTLPSLDIQLPNSTVNLSASDSTTKYNVVKSTTAENTLIIGPGVTINTLYIYQGNVVIEEGAIVGAIFDCSNGTSTITGWENGGSTEGEVSASIQDFTSGN